MVYQKSLPWFCVFLVFLPEAIFFSVQSDKYPSICDAKAFPYCLCSENDTISICYLDDDIKLRVSGDHIPNTIDQLVFMGGNEDSAVIVKKEEVSPIKLRHLVFLGLGVLDIQGSLEQVDCVYLLRNTLQTIQPNCITSDVDVTYVFDDMYPGLGVSLSATQRILNFMMKACEVRMMYDMLQSGNCNVTSTNTTTN